MKVGVLSRVSLGRAEPMLQTYPASLQQKTSKQTDILAILFLLQTVFTSAVLRVR